MPRAFRSQAAVNEGYFNVDLELRWYRTDFDSDPNKDRTREAKRRWERQLAKMRAGKTRQNESSKK